MFGAAKPTPTSGGFAVGSVQNTGKSVVGNVAPSGAMANAQRIWKSSEAGVWLECRIGIKLTDGSALIV